MTIATTRRIGLDPRVNAPGGANGAKSGDILVRCHSCLGTFKPRNRFQRFCSSQCRLRGWAVRDLTKAVHEGTIEGLRGEFRACIAEIVKEKR